MLNYVENLSGGKRFAPSFARICAVEIVSAKSLTKPLRWFRRCQITLIPNIASTAHKIFSLIVRQCAFSYELRPGAHHIWNTC